MSRSGRTVEIESGRISGVSSPEGVTAFKGVPYAHPPLGALRWQPPKSPTSWAGVRDCSNVGPRCIQPDRPVTSIGYYGPEVESEDCLYLNVWTANDSATEKQPVMVWFHGGAFFQGSGAIPPFQGQNLAPRGVVVVTVNYRLGRLGFLAHPEFTLESSNAASGNYGLLDQIAALSWIKRNIAAFGGDPDCVTIFGQSAGSISISILMASPLARGLFHRIIGQSGALFGPVGPSCNTGDSIQALSAAEEDGLRFGKQLGATSSGELRSLDAHDIQLARRRFDGHRPSPAHGVFDTSWPIIDGYLLLKSPYEIFLAGEQNDVPLIVGNTANEGATMPSAGTLQGFVSEIRDEHGDRAQKLLELYPARNDDEARIASRTAFSFRNFYWQNWTWARLQARTGKAPVYYYQFTRIPPIPPDANFAETRADEFGAFHCAELPYIFRNLKVRDWPWTAWDRTLSEQMSSYWVAFAKAGDPNGSGREQWRQFDETSRLAMHFGDEVEMGPVPDWAKLEFWDDFYAAQREARQLVA